MRPFGAKLKTFGGRASGPLPLARMLIDVCEVLSEIATVGGSLNGIAAMEIDHAIAQCVVAGGVRRSARMSMMHWQDPQIEEFVRCKQETGKHWTTNISVIVDDLFWTALNMPNQVSIMVRDQAHKALKWITDGMVANGEPGFWDSSLSNQGEPNEVVCTNPCGEITLQEWEPCNLGHINLAAFVKDNGKVDTIDLIRSHRLMARFLIRATFSRSVIRSHGRSWTATDASASGTSVWRPTWP